MLKLHNTLTRRLEDFQPIHDALVGLYSCGPTVYWTQHIGNFRAFIFVDTLKRVLRFNHYAVKHVMNITDVGHLTSDADEGEDKLEKGAKREGLSVWEVASKYTAEFQSDFAKLNLIIPDILAKATDHIADMIGLIERLAANGHTYATSQALYFDVATFPTYGRLTGQSLDTKKTGAREAVVTDPEKKHPADFALWFKRVGKFATHEMYWPSPWGDGFPGWHIECSAMSIKYLGEQFDLHTGGVEHVPVHHTNEIAQAEGATGKSPFACYWLHNEHLQIPDGKMSKSLGNIVTISDIEQRGINPLAFRYLALQTNYRKPMAFSWEALQGAEAGLKRVWRFVRSSTELPTEVNKEYYRRFLETVNSDLNTAGALAIVSELIDGDLPIGEKMATLAEFDKVLGLGLRQDSPLLPPKEALEVVTTAADEVGQEILELNKERLAAKKIQDFAKADQLRLEIETLGYKAIDTPGGTQFQPLPKA